MNTTKDKKITLFIGRIFSFPISPRKQFRRLVFVLIIALAGVVLFHVYLFHRISSRNIFQSTVAPASTAPIINEKKLTDVLSRYEEKSKKRMELQTNPVVVEDPSR